MPWLVVAHGLIALAPPRFRRAIAGGYLVLVAGLAWFEAGHLSEITLGRSALVEDPGLRFTLLHAMTAVGGAAALWWIASLWTRYAMGQGFLLVPAVYFALGFPAVVTGAIVQTAEGQTGLLPLVASAILAGAVAVAATAGALRLGELPFALSQRLVLSHPLDAIALPLAAALVGRAVSPETQRVSAEALAALVAAVIVAAQLGRAGAPKLRVGYLLLAGVAPLAWIGAVGWTLSDYPDLADVVLPGSLGVRGPTAEFEIGADQPRGPHDTEILIRRIADLGGRAEVEALSDRRLHVRVTGPDPQALLTSALRRRTVELFGASADQGALDPARFTTPIPGIDVLPIGQTQELQGPRERIRQLLGRAETTERRRPMMVCQGESCSALYVDLPPIISPADIAGARTIYESGMDTYAVQIELTPPAAVRFEAATRRLVGHRIVLVIDGEVDSAPIVQSAIPGGRAMISLGNFSRGPEAAKAEARALASALNGGRLSAVWSVTRRIDPPE